MVSSQESTARQRSRSRSPVLASPKSRALKRNPSNSVKFGSSVKVGRDVPIALTTMVENVKHTLHVDGIPKFPLSVVDEEKYRNLVSGAINDIENFPMDSEGLDAIETMVKDTFENHALGKEADRFLGWFEFMVQLMCLQAFSCGRLAWRSLS